MDILAILWVTVLSFFAFAPFHLALLTWFAPWGIFWLGKKYSGKYKILFYRGLLLAVIFNGIAFYWIVHMMTVFGGFPMPVAVPLFLVSGILLQFKFPFYLVLSSWLNRKKALPAYLIPPFVMMLAELVIYQIFPWQWGNLAAGHEYLAQLVEFTGVYGLTAVVFFVSYGFFLLAEHLLKVEKLSERNIRNILIYTASVLIIGNLSGWLVFTHRENAQPEKYVNVLVIQPDAPLEFRDGRSFRESMLSLMNRIESLVEKGAREQKPDLIVLPESGVPFFSAHNSPATNSPRPYYWDKFEAMIVMFALKYGANVYFNEIDADVLSDGRQYHYNNSAIYDAGGTRRDSYRKSYLLVFGEYMPFEFMYMLSPQTAKFMPGEKQNLLGYYQSTPPGNAPDLKWKDTSDMSIGNIRTYYSAQNKPQEPEGSFLPLICYEVILPEFVRKFRKNGDPGFIVNITNDKWYGRSVETFQHLDLARLRSIEHRLWMVRSTNSGSTAVIDHMGRIVNNRKTEMESSDYYNVIIPVLNSAPTFYVRYGNLLPWLFIMLVLLLSGYRQGAYKKLF